MKELKLFQAFCDASGIFDRRFQSIGVVSGNVDTLDELRSVLASIIDECEVREIKFTKITRHDSRDYRAALAFIKRVINGYCRYYRIRVDIMTWDTTDSRNAIPGRNDIENLGRLYYHLLLNVTKRWPEGEWNVIIDENEKVDFAALKARINCNAPLLASGTLPEIIYSTSQLEELDVVKEIKEVASHEEPLVQLADLFAGMARYSHEQGTECCIWLASKGNPDQLPLLDFSTDDDTTEEYSSSQECRFQLIGELSKICKNHRLGVSLKTEKRLWSPNPNNPVNFWLYTPQGDYDKAPIG
jgi:hypothetical protein